MPAWRRRSIAPSAIGAALLGVVLFGDLFFGNRATAAEIAEGSVLTVQSDAEVRAGEKVVATLPKGTSVTVRDRDGDWVYVEAAGGQKEIAGWIEAKLLKTTAEKESPLPNELAKTCLSPHRIEPPDVIQIELLRMVPAEPNPYRVRTFDVLSVNVLGTLMDAPIANYYLVDADGCISLGPAYGSVRVLGMSLQDVKDAIETQLLRIVRQAEVSVDLARVEGTAPVTGLYPVLPDGTVNLRQYGCVSLVGKTVAEAKLSIEEHLRQFFDSPTVSVEIAQFNSKSFHVIVEDETGDRVLRFPCLGNECILDALAQVDGLPRLSGRNLKLARPTRSGAMVVPLDWEAIKTGDAGKNLQVFPGDRIIVSE